MAQFQMRGKRDSRRLEPESSGGAGRKTTDKRASPGRAPAADLRRAVDRGEPFSARGGLRPLLSLEASNREAAAARTVLFAGSRDPERLAGAGALVGPSPNERLSLVPMERVRP
ncbi:hypothetical protein NDU88_006852 [Pleurodeles waltl]|uniref:Uncharacterized protein n=1 Tax=Pleurodeles waltl TaxID=8319 RepID=A0AAV7ML73_PLEWA|nr:hypothetical protein NDU88_006852 [Pleurodeles waltl]